MAGSHWQPIRPGGRASPWRTWAARNTGARSYSAHSGLCCAPCSCEDQPVTLVYNVRLQDPEQTPGPKFSPNALSPILGPRGGGGRPLPGILCPRVIGGRIPSEDASTPPRARRPAHSLAADTSARRWRLVNRTRPHTCAVDAARSCARDARGHVLYSGAGRPGKVAADGGGLQENQCDEPPTIEPGSR